MGKLTEAFNKLDAGRKSFVADVDHWQSEVTKRWAAVSAYQKAMSQLMIVDDKVLNQIGDAKARSAKAVELADARGKKLAAIDPMGVGDPHGAQEKAFTNCQAFGKLIASFEAVLKTYDTKGKPTKEQKKVAAEKLLLEAKIDLAHVKKAKTNYEYQGDGKAMYEDVVAIGKEIEELKKKLAEMIPKLKADVVGVEG